MIALGYRAPQETVGSANIAVPVQAAVENNPTVDEVVAASIAADIAQSANLPVAASAVNLSVSTQIKSELAQADDSIISKPTIAEPSTASRSIVTHTVVDGENIATIAAKYNVSPQTVKWANNLTTDAVAVGRTLEILPVDGISYTVKAGDTVDSIAQKYKADASRITVYNDLESSGVSAGLKVVIPSGTLPDNERPGYVAPVSYSNYSSYADQGSDVRVLYRNSKPTTPGNTNAWGNCTWYVWERRAEVGRPLPSRALGNAAEWDYTLRGVYPIVRGVPEVGAILQTRGFSVYGHVAFVESKNADGSITISEMNYAGYNVVSQRTISASQVGLYTYIY